MADRPCDCYDGGELCEHCGGHYFRIDCSVWHDVRRERDAAVAVLKRIDNDGIACDYQCGWNVKKNGERFWDCGCGNADIATAVKAALSAATDSPA